MLLWKARTPLACSVPALVPAGIVASAGEGCRLSRRQGAALVHDRGMKLAGGGHSEELLGQTTAMPWPAGCAAAGSQADAHACAAQGASAQSVQSRRKAFLVCTTLESRESSELRRGSTTLRSQGNGPSGTAVTKTNAKCAMDIVKTERREHTQSHAEQGETTRAHNGFSSVVTRGRHRTNIHLRSATAARQAPAAC